MKVFGQLAIFNKDLKNCEELKEKELIEAKELFSDLVNEVIGGFQLEFVSISRIINHMTCYNSSALIGGKLFFPKSPLQDLLSSLNNVILTKKSTQFITGQMVYNLAFI